MNTANRITISRIALIPFFILFLFILGKLGVIISFFMFALCSFSDWLDGYIARRKNQATTMGKIMDPVADKILVYSGFICFIYLHVVPFWMVIVIMSRDFLVMALRVQLAARGYVLAPSRMAKLKTVLEYAVLFFAFFYLLVAPGLVQMLLRACVYSIMGAATIFATLSGIQYVLQGRRMLIE